MPYASSPHAQANYQVRFEWGLPGLARLAPPDVVVVVQTLGLSSEVLSGIESGAAVGLDDRAASIVAEAAADLGVPVLVGGIRNARAVAAHLLDLQRVRAARTSIAIIAVGAADEADVTSVRFAVEDLLGAGAVIAALGDLGIDHASPDAAVAGEGFRALRGATRHLLSASGTGRALADAGRAEVVQVAAARDAASVVPVLVDGVFRVG